ncbi:kinase-like domain-containing protein [Rhizoctonia solani]|nr:kinase-like domain-containing protein [Rhizoctonia solani]
MFELLACHGCPILVSQMDPMQDTAVLMSGGGFGDIWRGELLDGTRVAIKTWRASLIEQCDYKILKRATREIYHWSKMKHENIHELMGVIMFKGQSLGMVSEWMEHGNLHEYLRKNSNADRYRLVTQVASGLAYIHSLNMVHGDIKALNALVSVEGVAKVTDFGLSTMSESSLDFSATTAQQAGSIRWAAPELLLEETAKSAASDIYALGMTILEIFSGNVPYPEYRRDYVIIQMVEQGVLPTRSTNEFEDNERGNAIWNLLVECWDRKLDARPLAKTMAESLVSISALGE